MLLDVLRVHQRDNAVKTEVFTQVIVHHEGLRDGAGYGEAGGCEQDGVEFVATLEQVLENADQVAAHGAADAPVVHLEDFLVGLDHEFVIDSDLAEFIFDHRNPLSVPFGQDAVQQRGFARTEEAGQDGDGDAAVRRVHGHFLHGMTNIRYPDGGRPAP